MKAIRLLVARKGGLHKVKLPGIANVLGLYVVLALSLLLLSPFPFMDRGLQRRILMNPF